VFAVETKTPRKIKSENGATVTVLENALQYPWGLDHRDIEQAQEEARWLTEWLSKMSPEPVNVGAILVLPGWFIDRRDRLRVTVLSGSEVAPNAPKLNGPATNDSEIRRLAPSSKTATATSNIDVAGRFSWGRPHDPATFRKHYLRRGLTAEEADEYFAARPSFCPNQAAA
jgi:hypothetical protein